MRTLATLILSFGFVMTASADDAKRTAQLADLAVVGDQYLSKELAYTPATRVLAQTRLGELEARAGTLSAAEWLVGLAQIGALTDNAHSGVRYGDPRALPTARLPLRLLWFPDALIVARATGDAADLAGARVLAIEGLAPDALYERTKSLQGGSAINRRKYLPGLIEMTGVLQALGVAKEADRIALKLKLESGKIVDRVVTMVANDTVSPTAEDERLWLPQAVAGEIDWKTAITADSLPAYLAEAASPFRTLPMTELDALYIQFRTNEDAPGHPIFDFTTRVDTEIATRKPGSLILDLRFDVGGNLLTTLAFMRALPSKVAGRTYLLVGNYTYSAGIISAAAVKKGGGDRVTVVGEELGDRLAFWSEGGLVSLPNSHFGLRYTNGTFDLEHGCAATPQCLDKLVDVNFVSLAPQIAAPMTSAAYFEKRDPALDAVREDITRRRREAGD